MGVALGRLAPGSAVWPADLVPAFMEPTVQGGDSTFMTSVVNEPEKLLSLLHKKCK